jgi:hypothetical protein
MRKTILSMAVAAAAFVVTAQGAQAQGIFGNQDPGITAASIGVGLASTGAYFALHNSRSWNHLSPLTATGAYTVSTIGCMAAAPIFATLLTNRSLTNREVIRMQWGCVIPILGPYIADAIMAPEPAPVAMHRGRH